MYTLIFLAFTPQCDWDAAMKGGTIVLKNINVPDKKVGFVYIHYLKEVDVYYGVKVKVIVKSLRVGWIAPNSVRSQSVKANPNIEFQVPLDMIPHYNPLTTRITVEGMTYSHLEVKKR